MHQELLDDPSFVRCYRRWQKNPKSAAFVGVADILRVHNYLEDAIEVCREGLRHQPDLISARLVLAQALDALDRKSDAHAVVLGILERAPGHLEAKSFLNKYTPSDTEIEAEAVVEEVEQNTEAEINEVEAVVVPREIIAEVEVEEGAAEEVVVVEEEPAPAMLTACSEVQSVKVIINEPEPEVEKTSARGSESGFSDLDSWATMTMARLYVSQGHYKEAEKIYRDMLRHEPDNLAVQQELQKLGEEKINEL